MIYRILLLAAFWALPLLLFASESTQKEMGLIRSRLSEWGLNYQFSSKTEANAQAAMNAMDDKGRFAEVAPNEKMLIDYLLPMVQAYVRGNELKGNSDLLNAVVKGLLYWDENRVVSTNWTVRGFLEPRSAAAMGSLLYHDLIEEERMGTKGLDAMAVLVSICENAWFSRVNSDTFQGANIAYRIHGLLGHAILANKPGFLSEMIQVLDPYFGVVAGYDWNGLAKIGLYPDGSWMQHNGGGAQNYWIGYGTSWLSYVLDLGLLVQGTQWQLSDKQLDVMVGYFIDGLQWYYYRGFSNYHVRGRHSLKREVYTPPQKIAALIDDLLVLLNHSSHKSHLLQIKEQLSENGFTVGSRYFYNAEHYIVSDSDYYVSLKMGSNRTAGPESGNGNGKKNFHFSSGTMLMLRSGTEYEKVRVAWDYNALPGLTAEQNPADLPLVDWGGGAESNNDFSGGLAKGEYGIASFQMDRVHAYANITANKSFFFTPEIIVASGSDILKKIPSEHPVTTTLDQSERNGVVEYFVNGKSGSIKEEMCFDQSFSVTEPSWFLHNKFGYIVVPKPDRSLDVRLQVENRTGDWNMLDEVYPVGSVSDVDVYQLSLLHEMASRMNDFVYYIVPAATKHKLDKLIMTSESPVIVSNNEHAHAVYFPENEQMMVSFFKKGQVEFPNGWQVNAGAPVILMFEKYEEQWQLHASDPLLTQVEVPVIINKKLKGSSNISHRTDLNSEIIVSFLPGLNAGAPVSYSFIVE